MQRVSASANVVNDPRGDNAFNKRDVNRDGVIDFVDAVTSDKFFTQDYTNIDQQLAATSDVRVGDLAAPFNLVDAELNDTGNIDQERSRCDQYCAGGQRKGNLDGHAG